jgi:CheY-like chemotaxis protein
MRTARRVHSPDRMALPMVDDLSEPPISGIVRSRRASVLVVDPSAASRAEIAGALSERFEIHEAVDGESAIRLAATIRPQVIITELDLPGINGFALTRMLTSTTSRVRGVPIVVLSARAVPREVAYAIAAGARRYIIKPCEPDALADVVGRLAAAQAAEIAQH